MTRRHSFIKLLIGSAAGASSFAALSGEMAGLVAVEAVLAVGAVPSGGSSGITASITASIATSVATEAPLGGCVKLVTLLAPLDGDALAADVFIIQIPDRVVGVFLISVLHECVGPLQLCYALG